VRGRANTPSGHIVGARHIPLGYLADRLATLPRESTVVTLCASGYRSQIAASLLQAAGFENVMALNEGRALVETAHRKRRRGGGVKNLQSPAPISGRPLEGGALCEQVLVDMLLGFVIGLSLGMLGGGGSILTVPALVYVVGQSPQAAVTASLVIVGANSAMGAFMHRSQGTLNWKVALVFGGVGMTAAYLAAGWSKLLPPTALMIALCAADAGGGAVHDLQAAAHQAPMAGAAGWVTIASGAGVGVMTGFLGVGGGFLIVPALVMLVGLPMRQAVGTSLVVIAMNSLAGFWATWTARRSTCRWWRSSLRLGWRARWSGRG
jgi:uncharacterized membrane protein YfcA/rhodanese-related sulfurtransferase